LVTYEPELHGSNFPTHPENPHEAINAILPDEPDEGLLDLGSATCQRIMVACQAGQVFPARQVFPAKAGFFGRQVFENSRSIFFKKM
jgi:hypothetical protein